MGRQGGSGGVYGAWGLTTMNADAYVNESEGTLTGYLGLLEDEVEVGVAVKSRDEIVCNVGKFNSKW
jgi:hypothetical protein